MAGEFAARPDERADDDALADARRWGLDDEEIAAVTAALGRSGNERLWVQHVAAFAALCAAGTQWRRRLVATADGVRELVAGLDYAGVKVAIDAVGIALTAEDWRQLRVLETEAVRALNGEVGA